MTKTPATKAETWAQKLAAYTSKYGVAWIVVNQTLGWITFIAIWLALAYTDVDIIGWLSQYKVLRQLTGNLSRGTGNLALAFGLNRLGTIPRIALTTWLMPSTAPMINAVANPWLKRFGVVLDHGPGTQEPTHPVDAQDIDDFPGVEADDDWKRNKAYLGESKKKQ
ncbi:hypothetical protein HDV03_005080 [Kappamyces sp. JEL0829]|nr:hypothetical protein HDV03_005080 [Kappamyces sp. JEL0829]KAJ3339559.1 hypothetical protein HDU91_000996 [Kappamyces sp. JEL0680]